MTIPLLKTKLYVPRVRPELVLRPRLIERLDVGLYRKSTLRAFSRTWSRHCKGWTRTSGTPLKACWGRRSFRRSTR
jgi:LuxR family maltose regulon positive regulatory protein